MSQCDDVLSYLKRGRSITPMEALDMYGIFRLAARIEELRDAGHKIETRIVDDPATGKRYASYRMVRRGN